MAKLDKDIKRMSVGRAHRELQRVRNAIRWHRNRKDNARCHHNDVLLYARVLPESKPAGRMDKPLTYYIPFCIRYIRGQQCKGCSISRKLKTIRKRKPKRR